MYIDWVTWSIWAFGLALLLYWCFETFHEFRHLFASRRRRNAPTRDKDCISNP